MISMLDRIIEYKYQQDKAGVVNQVYRISDQEVVDLFYELEKAGMVSYQLHSAIGFVNMFCESGERWFLKHALDEYGVLYGVKLKLAEPVYESTTTYRYC